MKVTVEIADEAAQVLGLTEENAARVLLEDAVAQAYREEKIGTAKLQEILGLSWYDKEQFLLRQKVYNDLTPEEIEAEVEVLRQARAERQVEKTAA